MGPASLTDRWIAMMVDWALCVGASYLLGPVVYLVTVRLLGLPDLVCVGTLAATPFVYLAYGWSRSATPGMKMIGLQMERAGGGTPGFVRAAARALLVYPFGFNAAALGIAIYGWYFAEYPSGAEPGTTAMRFGVLVGISGLYLIAVLVSRRQARGRALHDLLTGVVVLGPVRETPSPAPRPPVRQISRWWLVLVPPGVLVTFVFAYAAGVSVAQRELGPSLVAVGIGGAALYGSWEIARRAVQWRRGPWGLPVPPRSRTTRRISRWFLALVPLGWLVGLAFIATGVESAAEQDLGLTIVAFGFGLAVVYGTWEILRRAVEWRRGPLSVPLPVRTGEPERISAWYLLLLVPGALALLTVGIATVGLAGELDGGSFVGTAIAAPLGYGLWELLRRAMPSAWLVHTTRWRPWKARSA